MAFHTTPFPSHTSSTIQYGLGKAAYSKDTIEKSSSWSDFTHLFLPKALTFPRKKDASPWVLPWTFEEGKTKEREKENVSHATLLTLDVDNKTPPYLTFEQAQQALQRATQDPQNPLYRQAAVLYTTWSHSPDHPHFRIFLPLSPDHLIHKSEQKKLRDLGHAVASILSIPYYAIDPSSFDVARLFFLPACPPESADLYQYAIFHSDPQTATFLDPDTILANAPAPASTPTKAKTDNVLPINPTIRLPVYQSSKTASPNPLSSLPANMDPKQYKKLMAVSAKCLKEQGEPKWTLQTLEDMQDAAPYMGLEDRVNYAILLNCLATYEEEIDNLSSDTEGPLPGRAFDLFTSMARQAKGYESTPEQEYRAHWEDVKAGGNEYGFKGFEAIHPGVLFRKALDNGWRKILVKGTPSIDLADLTWDYSKKWPFPFRNDFNEVLNPITVGEWVAKEAKGFVWLEGKGSDIAREWRYEPRTGIFFSYKSVPFAEHICTELYHYLKEKEKDEKEIKILSSTSFHSSVRRLAFTQQETIEENPIPMLLAQKSDFNTVKYGHILPVANGFLDLRKKKLVNFSHSEKMAMKFSLFMPTPYYEDAPEPVEFLEFLNTACLGRQDMIEDLRDFFASVLWGTPPGMAAILHGEGGNGKSVLVSTIMNLFEMGTANCFTKSLSFATLQEHNFIATNKNEAPSSAPKPELIPLIGKRMVRIQETVANMELDEAMLKKLYGSKDSFIFRTLFDEESITIQNTATLVIETNEIPTIKGGHAMDRRLVFFPFEHKFTVEGEQTEEEKKKETDDLARMYYEKEGPSILKWLVHAKHPNKKTGWGPTVLEDTKESFSKNNPYRRFVEECIEVTGNPKDVITTNTMLEMYKQWAARNKEGDQSRVANIGMGLMKRLAPFMPKASRRTRVNGEWRTFYETVRPTKEAEVGTDTDASENIKFLATYNEKVLLFFKENLKKTGDLKDCFSTSEAFQVFRNTLPVAFRDRPQVNETNFGIKLDEWAGKAGLEKKRKLIEGKKTMVIVGAILRSAE